MMHDMRSINGIDGLLPVVCAEGEVFVEEVGGVEGGGGEFVLGVGGEEGFGGGEGGEGGPFVGVDARGFRGGGGGAGGFCGALRGAFEV